MAKRARVSLWVARAAAAGGLAVAVVWWVAAAFRAPSEAVWLSDFESLNEQIVRWEIQDVLVVRSSEHATHGRHSAVVTFRDARAPRFVMHQYLTRNRRLRDWSRYGTLHFDLYNPQPSQESVTLELVDQAGRSYTTKLIVPGKTAYHAAIPLEAAEPFLDLSCVEKLALSRSKPGNTASFFLDAVRLEIGPPRPRTDAAAPPSAVTPNILWKLAFEQEAGRWQVAGPASRQPRTRVPVRLIGPEHLPLSVGFPVSGGVPFPMGQLAPGAPVELRDPGGVRWPLQAKPLAAWEDGSVKWLLVTTQVPPEARGRQLWLEYGTSVARPQEPPRTVQVTETPESIVVNTGLLQFSVSRSRFTLFESAAVDRNGDGLFADDERLAGAGDLVVKHNGTEFRSSRDAQTYRLDVEEAGPLRATLRASGWFRDAEGRGFCQFIVRMQVFAGLPQVRLYHTFVYTGYPANPYYYEYKHAKLPENEPIQEISVELPVTVTALASVASADETGAWSVPLRASTTVSQLSHDAYTVRQAGAEAPLHQGIRNEGWVLAQTASAGVMVNVRDAWQQFPKEFVADPTSGRLLVKLWPESAGELSLETGPEAYGPDDVARGSAFGLAKTHELVVSFLGVAIPPATAQALAGLWQEPWLLMAEPEWLQATAALGIVGPADAVRFGKAERMLDKLFEWAVRQPDDFHWYGMLDYGDTLIWYRKEAYDKSYDEWGWHPEGRWGWHNCEAVGSHMGALVSFLRTGALGYFRFGEAKARHVMDVDTVHYNTVANDPRLRGRITDRFSQVGSMHRHSAYHWSGRNEEATHTHVGGILLYYYLTGYERAWDVANEVGGFFLRDPVTYTQHPHVAPLRAIANVLWGDVQMYEATWDPRYLRAAERWVKVVLRGQQPDGTWRETYNPLIRIWIGEIKNNYIALHTLPALMAYHRLTGDPVVAGAIVKGTDAMVRREAYLQFFDALAYSYFLTGKRSYLDEGLRRIQQLVDSQKRSTDRTLNGMFFNKRLYDHVGPTLYAVPFLLGALDAKDFLAKSTEPLIR